MHQWWWYSDMQWEKFSEPFVLARVYPFIWARCLNQPELSLHLMVVREPRVFCKCYNRARKSCKTNAKTSAPQVSPRFLHPVLVNTDEIQTPRVLDALLVNNICIWWLGQSVQFQLQHHKMTKLFSVDNHFGFSPYMKSMRKRAPSSAALSCEMRIERQCYKMWKIISPPLITIFKLLSRDVKG